MRRQLNESFCNANGYGTVEHYLYGWYDSDYNQQYHIQSDNYPGITCKYYDIQFDSGK